MVSVLHKFLGTSVLLPTLSAASNLAQLDASNAPPPSFYAVLRAVHRWVDAYKASRVKPASTYTQNAVLS